MSGPPRIPSAKHGHVLRAGGEWVPIASASVRSRLDWTRKRWLCTFISGGYFEGTIRRSGTVFVLYARYVERP